jgi:Fe2+ or Zn2+ uptake regulation protein
LEELRESKIHPTAADVYESVRKRLPKISLATVYRTLESLAAMGVIRKLETTGREYRFDGDVEPHHHLRCRICGRFEDIERIPPIVEWVLPGLPWQVGPGGGGKPSSITQVSCFDGRDRPVP